MIRFIDKGGKDICPLLIVYTRLLLAYATFFADFFALAFATAFALAFVVAFVFAFAFSTFGLSTFGLSTFVAAFATALWYEANSLLYSGIAP